VPLLLKLAPELRANRAAADARASERDDR
jgi:hypothetical protein